MSARRLLAFLGVQPAEERGAALMTAHSFFMGCATVFFETAASATFLSRFASSYLPWVYIAAAGVNTITGTVYSRVQERASFKRLMQGTLWFLLAIVVAVRVGFAVTAVAWVAFAGLVSYRIISSLTDLEYWAVASRIYDVRQAKRLFGLIGTGEVTARIVGAFSVPALVKLGGVSNLMVLSAGALALCLLLLGAVLRGVTGIDAPMRTARAPGPGANDARAGVREILASRYLLLVVALAILATLGKYFVDFAFLQQLSTVSKGEEHLATVLGLFSGITQTLSLLTRLFVARPLLHRFGVRVGVMVLPVIHAICAALTVACGALDASAVVVFWFVIANQGIYKAFKHPIDNASFKVLYQPLRPEQRLATQIAVEVVFSPIVVGVAGGIMLLFSSGMRYDPVRFSCVLLACFVAWALLARAAGRAYGARLLETLRRRLEGDVAFPFDDATTLEVLRSRLTSPVAAEVCVALSLLENADAPDLGSQLAKATRHTLPEVRRYALGRILELDPSVLLALRAESGADPAHYLDDADLLVRRAAISVLFAIGDAPATATGTRAIEALVASERTDERALGARLAGEHQLEAALSPLLEDAEPDVRRAALIGAGRLHGSSKTAVLFDHLTAPRFADSAVQALASRGDGVIEEVVARFEAGADRTLLRKLVGVLRLVGGPNATKALFAEVTFPDLAVRARVVAALDALDFTAEGDERAAIRSLVLEEAREAAWTLGVLRDLGPSSDLEALRTALEADVASAGRRLFKWLAFVHDRVAVRRVEAHIAHASKETRAYAQEALDLMLDADEREVVLPLLDETTNAERLARLEERFPQQKRTTNERLRELIARSDRWIDAWTRALALRTAGERGLHDGLAHWTQASDPLVRETATWALEPKQRGGDRMLLIEKIIVLKMVQMFANTSEELLAEIAGIVEVLDVKQGDVIINKGEKGDSMYVVVRGSVRVFDGKKTLRTLGTNEIFGELALLDPEPRSASVDASTDARLFRLDRDTFTQLMAGNVEIVRGVLHVLCERLRAQTADAATRASLV